MNKGSSQESRKNKALAADYVAIDDRSLIDLVYSTLELAKTITFYDFRNTESDNWNTFLLKDPAFIIAMIAATNTDKFKINHESPGNHKDETHKPEELNHFTRNIYEEISGWYNLLSNAQYKGSLLNEIQNSLSNLNNWLTENNQNDPDASKENYEHLYGSLVFIKNKALKHFDEELKKSNHHPHIGLLLAFFKLFQNVQQDINVITKRHLDFYFLDLLKQQKKKPEPHTAIISLQLQQGIDSLSITEGEKFDLAFGENQSLTFKATSYTQINKAKIAEINTLYKSDYLPFGVQSGIDKSFSINRLYEATIRKEKTDNKTLETPEHEYFPATLGEESNIHEFSGNDIKQSEIGFLISSPALILEKGKKNIQITFKITSDSYEESILLFEGLIKQEIKQENNVEANREKLRSRIVSQFFSDAFLIYITDKEGWKLVDYSSVRINHDNYSLDFSIPLVNKKNTLVAFDSKIHNGDIETQWPCIKFILNNDTQYYAYKALKNIVVEEINIKASVADVTRLKLSNSSGNIDNTVPFMPFGPTPVTGNFLRIQNPLIFQKNLVHLELSINWLGLPQVRDGFTSHYQAYPGNINNKIFKAVLTRSRNKLRGKEKQMQQEVTLFKSSDGFLSNEKNIDVKTNNFVFNAENSGSENVSEDNSNALYMVLANPEIAFGHKIFNEIYAEAAMKMSKAKKTTFDALPNQPYTPFIERLEVSYTNVAREIMMRKLDNNATDIKLVHLYPFGNVQVFPGPLKSQSFLFPQFEHNGHLFIGLQQVESDDIVNIGFELEPAVYVNTVINAPKIQWEYLLNNSWEPFREMVLEDTTNGLIRSGIVKIQMPRNIQFDNSRLPRGKFWIRAVYSGKEELRSKIKNVFTQAVSLISNDNPEFLPPTIQEPELLKKITIEGRKNIAQIKGPYALRLCEPVESDDTFYSRTSEKLRHKNRVVTNWDAERIILDKFKQIEKVRAYGRNSHANELVKGSTLQIILIPKNKTVGSNRLRSTKVDFSTLNKVKEYISQFVSPHVNVEVSNPVYEQLKIRCSVKFNKIQKAGYYKNILNNELIGYLSPDIENELIEKGFDESISKTEILNFIESRPYVDFVTEFSVLQLVEVQGRYKIIDTAKIQKINDLRTISAYAILTSAPEHQINIIQDEKTEKSKVSGIGDLSVEADFIISDGDGNYI